MQPLNIFPLGGCFVDPDKVVVAGSIDGGSEEGEDDHLHRAADEEGDDRDARQRKLNYSTKVFEGVPIIVKGDICRNFFGSN